ncbi:MAG: hypothetical protein KAJ12_03375, partial [Bacteroidetes bacterium]|nr:hypothetical protein [Bacteroidota bacterium]
IIEIKRIAREPGERAKVAVESHDDRIDAVGACVGMKGVRIHTIVRELNNENIDVINFTEDHQMFIQRALAPAKLKSLELNKETKTANVLVTPDQVSLAIGRNGQNIRLASRLTEYEINLIKEGGEDEYDIELIDFKPELGEELYLKLIEAGLETAKDIITAKFDDLLAIEGLDEEKIREVREMLKKDLEEAEVEEEELEFPVPVAEKTKTEGETTDTAESGEKDEESSVAVEEESAEGEAVEEGAEAEEAAEEKTAEAEATKKEAVEEGSADEDVVEETEADEAAAEEEAVSEKSVQEQGEAEEPEKEEEEREEKPDQS